jgi:hypothetical protein
MEGTQSAVMVEEVETKPMGELLSVSDSASTMLLPPSSPSSSLLLPSRSCWRSSHSSCWSASWWFSSHSHPIPSTTLPPL